MDTADSDGVVRRFDDPQSARAVVLEDDGRVAYAYLLVDEDIVSEVWLYNVASAPEEPEWPDTSKMPFLNPKEYWRTHDSLPRVDEGTSVECRWREDGVDVLLSGILAARLKVGAKPAWSRLAAKPGPLARPFRELRRSTETEKRFEPVFNEALAARHSGDLETAVRLCESILREVDPSEERMRAITHNELGAIYLLWLRPVRPDLAEQHFRVASTLSPRADLYSLGLFHSLLKQSRSRDALVELCRLLSVRDCDDYQMILDGPPPELDDQQELLEEARSLARRWRARRVPRDPG